MKLRRILTIAAVLAIVLGAGLFAAGFFDPRPDPEFERKLIDAPASSIEPMIAKEAERLDVTALAVIFAEEGDPELGVFHFGRSDFGSIMQAASLSKAVAAAVILTLAEREGVSLDEDIRPQITSLDIASLEGGNRPVTFRQLLSHTSGASQSGYPGYPRGQAVPSTSEVIAAPPRFFESALIFDGKDGEFRYSGGGYTIAQLWAEDVSGKDFEALSRELLFGPLGMTKSTFAQPIEETREYLGGITGADAGFDLTQALFASLDNSWHNYPEKAAAGLWTTPKDYAIFVATLLEAASGEESEISASVASAMLTPQAYTGWGDEPLKSQYGLGLVLELNDDGTVSRISHTGANAGYRAHFIALPRSDDGPIKIAVSMANTGNAGPLNRAIVEALVAH